MSLSPEKKRAYNRAYYLRTRERWREHRRLYSAVFEMPKHRPDGRMPKELTKEIRLKVLLDGGDPGSTHDVRVAMVELWEKEPEGTERYGWLHPDEAILPSRLSNAWRNSMSEESRQKLLDEVGRMSCSNHDSTHDRTSPQTSY